MTASAHVAFLFNLLDPYFVLAVENVRSHFDLPFRFIPLDCVNANVARDILHRFSSAVVLHMHRFDRRQVIPFVDPDFKRDPAQILSTLNSRPELRNPQQCFIRFDRYSPPSTSAAGLRIEQQETIVVVVRSRIVSYGFRLSAEHRCCLTRIHPFRKRQRSV